MRTTCFINLTGIVNLIIFEQIFILHFVSKPMKVSEIVLF